MNKKSKNTASSIRRKSLQLAYRNNYSSVNNEASVKFTSESNYSRNHATHPLVNDTQNRALRNYETEIKGRFDNIEPVLKSIISQQLRPDFKRWANNELFAQLGVTLDDNVWDLNLNSNSQRYFQELFSKIVFAQFMRMSKDFFVNDPLGGQIQQEARQIFNDSGIHAVGIAPCADGRLAHFVSYVLRLPYSLARRKAHAGALFDISESVRNWVFIEHSRFRESKPNSADESTRYLKVAAYHFSKADPSHQGCAAHGSDDNKAAEAALAKLKDFRQAIENRFGCGSTVETILIGVNTDDDSLKVHVPNENGRVCLERYVETSVLYSQTKNMSIDDGIAFIKTTIDGCNINRHSTKPQAGIKKLLAWFIANNFSQIEYVNNYEQGCYDDIGHAERFIGIGSGFEEVQLRNLSYYSFLDTIEEGVNDVDVGIKIFKGLNIKRGLPIPIIIRCDYDGRVPGSKERAKNKAIRLEKAVHNRYQELSACGLLQTMATLRDYTGCQPVEKLA